MKNIFGRLGNFQKNQGVELVVEDTAVDKAITDNKHITVNIEEMLSFYMQTARDQAEKLAIANKQLAQKSEELELKEKTISELQSRNAILEKRIEFLKKRNIKLDVANKTLRDILYSSPNVSNTANRKVVSL